MSTESSTEMGAEPPRFDAKARAVVGDLVAGNFAAIRTGFDPVMAAGLSEAKLARNWRIFLKRFGDFQSAGNPSAVKLVELTVEQVPIRVDHSWPADHILGLAAERSFVDVMADAARFRFGWWLDQTLPRTEIIGAGLARPAPIGAGLRMSGGRLVLIVIQVIIFGLAALGGLAGPDHVKRSSPYGGRPCCGDSS